MGLAILYGGRRFSSVGYCLGALRGPLGVLADHQILRELAEDTPKS